MVFLDIPPLLPPSENTVWINSVLKGFISFMHCIRLLGEQITKEELSHTDKLHPSKRFIIEALTHVLASLDTLLRHTLKYGSVYVGERNRLLVDGHWQPWCCWKEWWPILWSYDKQGLVLCCRHCLTKSRGLWWVTISAMADSLGGLGGLGLGWVDQLWHGGI